MIRKVALSALLLALSSPALAFTAAELTQSDRRFSEGYVFGVIEWEIGAYRKDEPGNVSRHRACLLSTKADSSTLHSVVISFINRNPKTLQSPAFGAVLQAIEEMCH